MTLCRRAQFKTVYQRHHREDWALAYARLMNADTAMDITQQAFLKLWKAWEAGKPIDNPRAWLMRVARNLAEDHAKSAFRRNGTSPPQVMNDVRAEQPLPDDHAQRREEAGELQVALAKLTERERTLLVMRYTLDMTIRQISEETGIPRATVDGTLKRALRRLRQLLAPSPAADIDPGLTTAS
jgi:RNA polymerase sigma-70 factor (ECF subfamily)